MDHKLSRYMLYGQLCFYLGLIICILIRPAGLSQNEGISYYGVYKNTILPYAFAFIGSAYFCLRLGLDLTYEPLKLLKVAFIVIAILILGVMVTPDTLSNFMDGLHRGFGITLFVLQLLLSFLLIKLTNFNYWAILFTLIELVGGIASFIYLAPPKGLLLQSQVLFQLGFGMLIIYSLPKAVNYKDP